MVTSTPINFYGWGMLVRVVSMLAILILPISQNAKILGIFMTDFIDCKVVKLMNYMNGNSDPKPCKTFNYQMTDKVIDVLTYFIVLTLFNLPPIFLYVAIYRLIGIGIFYLERDSSYLTCFPDIFKELYLYSHYVGSITPISFSTIAFLKCIFEYIFHLLFNGNNYKKKKNEH